jgi:hypothetical protein
MRQQGPGDDGITPAEDDYVPTPAVQAMRDAAAAIVERAKGRG